MKSLTFYFNNNKKIIKGFLPKNIKYLYIKGPFKMSIKENVFPNSLKYIFFEEKSKSKYVLNLSNNICEIKKGSIIKNLPNTINKSIKSSYNYIYI